MKRLFLLLWLIPVVAFATNPAIGIHVVNSAVIGSTTYTSTTGHTSATSGSSFIVAFGATDNTGCSATDSESNTYSLVTLGTGTNPIEDTNDASYLWLLMAQNGAGGANHTVTVTCGGTIFSVDFIEITGANTTTPIDVSAAAYSGTTPLNLPVTTTQANDLVLGLGYSAGGNIARTIGITGSGFSALDSFNSASVNYASGDLANATTGAHDPTFTRTGGVIAGMTVAFAPGSGGGSSAPPQPSPFAIGASLLPRGVNLASFADHFGSHQ